MAGGLDGAGLMDVDVAGMGGDHRLVGPQHGGDGHKIDLGTAHQEMNIRRRRGAQAPDGVRSGGAAGVQTVAHGLGEIGVGEGFQDSGVRPLAVIVAKAVHVVLPRSPEPMAPCIREPGRSAPFHGTAGKRQLQERRRKIR